MLISCEQCSTTYSFDDHLVSPEGLSVQCTCCGYVFIAKPEPPSFFAEGRVTQLFGVSPEERMLLAPASPASSSAVHSLEHSLEYGHSDLADSTAQTHIHEELPNAIAYFDLEANPSGEDPLTSQFSSTPVESPSSSASPSSASCAAVAPAPPQEEQQAPSVSQTVVPVQQRLGTESLVDEVWQAEELLAQSGPSRSKQNVAAGFLAHEEASPFQPQGLPSSSEPLPVLAKSKRKPRCFFVISLAMIVATALAVWLIFNS